LGEGAPRKGKGNGEGKGRKKRGGKGKRGREKNGKEGERRGRKGQGRECAPPIFTVAPHFLIPGVVLDDFL